MHYGKRGMKRTTSNHTDYPIQLNNEGEYVGGYEALWSLVSHSNQRNYNELFQYTLLAIYLLKMLK